MKNMRPVLPAARQQGVVLLETLIAILIFSFGILGVVGLQATMLKGATEAKYRAEAGYVVQKRIGEIWATGASDLTHLTPYIETGPTAANISNTSGLPSGSTRTTTFANDPNCGGDPTCATVVTVQVFWRQPGELLGVTHNVMTVARITP